MHHTRRRVVAGDRPDQAAESRRPTVRADSPESPLVSQFTVSSTKTTPPVTLARQEVLAVRRRVHYRDLRTKSCTRSSFSSAGHDVLRLWKNRNGETTTAKTQFLNLPLLKKPTRKVWNFSLSQYAVLAWCTTQLKTPLRSKWNFICLVRLPSVPPKRVRINTLKLSRKVPCKIVSISKKSGNFEDVLKTSAVRKCYNNMRSPGNTCHLETCNNSATIASCTLAKAPDRGMISMRRDKCKLTFGFKKINKKKIKNHEQQITEAQCGSQFI